MAPWTVWTAVTSPAPVLVLPVMTVSITVIAIIIIIVIITPGQFQCPVSGKCVIEGWLCDGEVDCSLPHIQVSRNKSTIFKM